MENDGQNKMQNTIFYWGSTVRVRNRRKKPFTTRHRRSILSMLASYLIVIQVAVNEFRGSDQSFQLLSWYRHLRIISFSRLALYKIVVDSSAFQVLWTSMTWAPLSVPISLKLHVLYGACSRGNVVVHKCKTAGIGVRITRLSISGRWMWFYMAGVSRLVYFRIRLLQNYDFL